VWFALLVSIFANTIAFAQLKVKGRFLYDQCGERIVLRGVNEMFIYSPDRTGVVTYPEIAKTGANAVRFLWLIDPKVSVSSFEENIKNCIANKMIPIPGLWNSTGRWGANFEACVQWWLQPEVVKICKKNPYLILNIANEAGGVIMADYTPVYIGAIKRLRKAGIRNVIMVDADRYGRAWETIRDKGVAVLKGDSQKNVLFSWHPWDSNIDYATPIKTIVAQNICLVVGEYSYKSVGCECCINYKQIMATTQTESVGSLTWSWGLKKNGDCTDGSMDMTTDGKFDGLKEGWATEIALSDPNSIKNTSVRPQSILKGGKRRLRR
jgi:mannan endo-1,4-beta-mannosidase